MKNTIKPEYGTNREFSQDETRMAAKHKYPTSLAIRKTTLRFYCIPVTIAKINKTAHAVKGWRGGCRRGNTYSLMVEVQTGAARVESSVEVSQEAEN